MHQSVTVSYVIFQKGDRGEAAVINKGGDVVTKGNVGLGFDIDTVSERVIPVHEVDGEVLEQYFDVELQLKELPELQCK